MILVGRNLSPFVRRVGASLRLLGLPYEAKPLSTVTDRDAIRAYNPLGRVPALVLDGGEVLIDSTPILDYLDELAGPGKALVPASGAARRHVLRLVAIGAGVAEKAVAAYVERDRRPEDKRHAPMLEQYQEQVCAGLAELEKFAEGGWLAEGRITQADVTTVAAFDFIRHVLADLVPEGRYPRLQALAARCNALPAFAETAF